jgi:hypothetical protein
VLSTDHPAIINRLTLVLRHHRNFGLSSSVENKDNSLKVFMSNSRRQRICIDISPTDLSNSDLFQFMSNSRQGVRARVLAACENYYYPLALLESGATREDVLNAAMNAVNQLHLQMQAIVDRIQQQGIEPTPLMLTKAGLAYHEVSSPPIYTKTTTVVSEGNHKCLDTERLDVEDEDDWGEDPPIPESRLAMIKESEKEMGIGSDG